VCRQVDDPEVLWSQAMREEELLPAVHSHLGAFPLRLRDHVLARYDYTPMPPMSYAALKGELWCFRYYLAKLCSPEHARSHPIVDHMRFRNVRAPDLALVQQQRDPACSRCASYARFTAPCACVTVHPLEPDGGPVVPL
jgi:hypothetical protein